MHTPSQTALRQTPRQQQRRKTAKLMRQLVAAFKARLDEQLKDHHVTSAQLRLLHELREHPGATGAQLARACAVTPQSVQTMLTRAAQNGWTRRGRDEENSRLVTLRLTPAGSRLLQYAETVVASMEDEIWSGVSAAELRALGATLTRALTNLQSASAAAPAAPAAPCATPRKRAQ